MIVESCFLKTSRIKLIIFQFINFNKIAVANIKIKNFSLSMNTLNKCIMSSQKSDW